MSSWEDMLNYPDYNTDVGDREKGERFSRKGVRLGDQSGPNAISLEEAFNRIGKLPGNPMLLVKTIKWGNKPGGFYAKAFISDGADWNTLRQLLNRNEELGMYIQRKAWTCGPGRIWI